MEKKRGTENRGSFKQFMKDTGITPPGVITGLAYGAIFGVADAIGTNANHTPLLLNIPTSFVMGVIAQTYFERFTRDTYGINNVFSYNMFRMKLRKGSVTLVDARVYQAKKMLTSLALGAVSGLIFHSVLQNQEIVSLPQGIVDVASLFAAALPPVAVGREIKQESKFLRSIMSGK